MGCSHCAVLCNKLGPNVIDIKNGIAVVARPEDCIGDDACMMACPTKSIFLMSKPTGKRPPAP
ncbi:MAG: 4Fe-4S binding protein [bacterium]|jgi:NAD-dependent dihydropyrimidine dehydrogenase PreA subunit